MVGLRQIRQPAATAAATAMQTRLFGNQRPDGRYWRFGDGQTGGGRGSRRAVWQTKGFWYVAGGSTAAGTVYYQAHVEESPTGRRRFINVSHKTEERMGRQSYQQVLREYGGQIVPQGTAVDRYVRRVAQRIIGVVQSEMDADWEIHVIDSPERNAFVLPGGKIFVFSGLLPIAESDDGLATVLAHEIAHQYARHPAEQMSRQTLLTVLLIAASLFVDPSALDLGRITSTLLLELPNSRACESEADRLGLMFMAAACYDPRQAVGFWERMLAEEQRAKSSSFPTASPPQFLSTHPSSRSRIDNIRTWLPDAIDKRASSACPDQLLTDSFFSALRPRVANGPMGWV
ncbi:metalloendopeptidase [Coemansia sp. RSA 1804]|nr:metalloendopeptidase [Coemansia sp. RSA 1804]